MLDVLAEPAELLAVELSSFQLHWAPSLRPEAGAVLNVAEDHLDWHGSMEAYAGDKARALDGRVAVVGLDDPVAAGLLDHAAAPVRVGFRLGDPAAGELGVRDGVLIDNAFGDCWRSPKRVDPGAGPVGVLDALAPRRWPAPSTCRRGHRRGAVVVSCGPAPRRGGRRSRRGDLCRRLQGHQPARAQASIAAYPRVVWIAGGLLKGASVDELVTAVANRLVGRC